MKEYTLANLMVARMVHKGKHRYALQGVYFAPDGSTVATDGRRLLVVGPAPLDVTTIPKPVLGDGPEDATAHEGFVIHAKDIGTVRRGMRAVLNIRLGNTFLKPRLFLKESTCGNGAVEFAATEGRDRCLRQTIPTVDGYFPRYDSVIPKRVGDTGTATVRYYNARLLGELLLAMADGGAQTVRFQFPADDPSAAVRLDAVGEGAREQSMVGVLMPVSIEGE